MRTRWVHCVMAAALLAACQDATGPESTSEVHDLIRVNDVAVPATVVDGSCTSWFFLIPFPDTIEVDGGRLTLGPGNKYEVYYMWRGKTDACTITGSHWHRISAGTYSLVGGSLQFRPDAASPEHFPTRSRNSSDLPTPRAVTSGEDILVEWGRLRLRFGPAH